MYTHVSINIGAPASRWQIQRSTPTATFGGYCLVGAPSFASVPRTARQPNPTLYLSQRKLHWSGGGNANKKKLSNHQQTHTNTDTYRTSVSGCIIHFRAGFCVRACAQINPCSAPTSSPHTLSLSPLTATARNQFSLAELPDARLCPFVIRTAFTYYGRRASASCVAGMSQTCSRGGGVFCCCRTYHRHTTNTTTHIRSKACGPVVLVVLTHTSGYLYTLTRLHGGNASAWSFHGQ